MNRRKFLLTLLLAVATLVANAQNAIAIYQKDGQVAKFAFTEKPVVTYSGSDLVLTTSKTIVQYPVYMLQKIAFDVVDLVANDIEQLAVKAEAQFSFQRETLTISGGEAGAPVYLYDVSGRKVGEYRLDPDGRTTIPVQNLGKSLYIVKTKTVSFKFRKS